MSVAVCSHELHCYWLCYKNMGSDITFGWVAFLLYIQEVQNWNFGSEMFVMTKAFLWFCFLLDIHLEIESEITLWPSRPMSFVSHCSLVVVPFDATWSELLTAPLNKQSANITRSLFHMHHVAVVMYYSSPLRCPECYVCMNTHWYYHVSSLLCTSLSKHQKHPTLHWILWVCLSPFLVQMHIDL